MKKLSDIKQTIINDSFKTIQDALIYYKFIEDHYDYEFDLFQYKLKYIDANILVPKYNDTKKVNKDNFGFQYQLYFTCYIKNPDYSIAHIATNDSFSAKVLEYDSTLSLLLSDHYIYNISDIPLIIEKVNSVNTYLKYQLMNCLDYLKKEVETINININNIEKILAD